MLDLEGLLRQSGGVLTHAQAMAGGLTSAQVHALVRCGHYTPLHRAVYLVGGRPCSPIVRARAALWAASGGVVSGALAALVHGIDLHRVDARPEVTLPPEIRRAQRATLRYRFCMLRPDEVVTQAGVRLTSPARTLRDIARTEARVSAAWAVEHALRAGLVRSDDLSDGSGAWRRLHELVDPASESPLETAGRLELVSAGHEVRAQHRVIAADGAGDVVVDLLVVGRSGRPSVAVEADGLGVHGRAVAIARDRRKQHVVQAAGLRLVRYTWYDVDERPGWLSRQVRSVQAG